MTVAPVASGITNLSTAPVNVWGTSVQLAVPTFVDQFGTVMSGTRLDMVHNVASANASAPVFTTHGGVNTVTFAMAGSYTLNARVPALRAFRSSPR